MHSEFNKAKNAKKKSPKKDGSSVNEKSTAYCKDAGENSGFHEQWYLGHILQGSKRAQGRSFQAGANVDSFVRKRLENLQFALDQAAIVAVTDTSGNILYANEMFCKISKYSQEELLGKNHRILNSGYHSTDYFRQMWSTISAGKVWRGEIRNRAKDGTIYWVFTTIIPFLDAENKKVVQYCSIRTDITELKRAKEREEQSRLALLHAEKMASLGELAAGIAHELGNPIAIIRGRMEFLEMQLQRNHVDKDAVLKVAQTVRDLADRMTRIIRGMQSLARDGSKDPFEVVPIHAIIRDVLEVSSEGLKKAGVRLLYNGYAESPRVYCKPTQISQVLMNLINNARDAVESSQEISDRWIRIEVTLSIDTVNVAVIDSGRGIPADIAARIMEPFYTTKDAGKGCGLGLSIAQTIMSHHKGSLKLDDNYASGNTCFVMTLPQGPLK